jgi:tetratricopeptide (TPR) repeat protein
VSVASQKQPVRTKKKTANVVAVIALALLIGFGLFVGGANYWAWCHYAAAEKDLARGDYRPAREHLESCLLVWSGNGQVQYWMARTERCLGNFDQAAERLDKCEKLNWSEKAIRLERTLLRAQQGEFAEVENDLRAWATEDNEDSAAVLEVLAEQYVRIAEFGRAALYCEKLLKYYPQNVRIHQTMGQIYLAWNDPPRAAPFLEKAVTLQPDNGLARQLLASVLVTVNQPKQALEHFTRLDEPYRSSQETLLGMARCYRASGEKEQYARALAKAAEKFPGSWEVLSEQGQLALDRGDLAGAEKRLRQAVALNGHHLNTLRLLSLCLRNKVGGDRAEAERVTNQYEQVKQDTELFRKLIVEKIPREPRNPDLYFELASVLSRLGDEKGSLDWLRRTLQIQPGHEGARKALQAHEERQRTPR